MVDAPEVSFLIFFFMNRALHKKIGIIEMSRAYLQYGGT